MRGLDLDKGVPNESLTDKMRQKREKAKYVSNNNKFSSSNVLNFKEEGVELYTKEELAKI